MKRCMNLQDGISVVVPSWNNLPYLRRCLEALQKYSRLNNEIIIHVNEGSDGTLEFVESSGLKFTRTPVNVGVCSAVNQAAELADRMYIGYFNDDMIALPDWDYELLMFCQAHDLPINSYLGVTLVQAFAHKRWHKELVICDCGGDIESFDEAKVVREIPRLRLVQKNRNTSWAPHIVHRDSWSKVGGLSECYDPHGICSDPDFAKKMWDIGCRDFVKVGRSLAYHFSHTVLRRFNANKIRKEGNNRFVKNHGMTAQHFVYKVLKRAGEWCLGQYGP